jgi:uncharacterized protein
MSLKAKLNRLKPHLSTTAHGGKKTDTLSAPVIEVPFQERWKQEGIVPYFIDHDYCLIREVKYPLSQKHGCYYFRDFLTAVDVWNNHSVDHPLSAKGHRAEELFFFDTETTGLGGGVGNTIFLLGYASVIGEELVLRQHILPHPGAEVPLYQSFLENVNYKTLVTYNGKSFDWPQVKTRHMLVREYVPKLPDFGHFDLFHAARRLWKHKLERMKLSIVEKEVLEVERVDDIPGFLAPMIYFDFIESKEPDGMIGIIKHNEMDILSLVSLYSHLTFQLCGIDQNQSRPESYEVGRWYAALGEKQQAEKVLNKLMTENDSTSLKAKLILAFQHKKERKWELARKLFEEIVKSGEGQMRLTASLELAKIFEHRLIDYELALKYCQDAIFLQTRSNLNSMKGPLTLEELEARKIRLERKYAKFPR